MISFNSLFEKINKVVPDPKMFFWIVVSVADAAAVNPKSTHTFLANGLSTFPIKEKPVFIKVRKSLSKKSNNFTISDSWFLKKFILVVETFAKVLRIFETCILVRNNLCRKLALSLASSIAFVERFRVTRVPFCIPDYNLLSCESDNFTFKVL